MPTPTIQAKLVLSTDQSDVTPKSTIGKDADSSTKKTNKILSKIGSTVDFTLGREGSKAFRTINWAMPLLTGVVSSIGASTLAVAAGITALGFAGKNQLKEEGDKFLKGLDEYRAKKEEERITEKTNQTKEKEFEILNQLIEAGILTGEGLMTMTDGTVELRDETGKLMAVFGDGSLSAQELALQMKLTSQVIQVGGNELTNAMIKSADAIIAAANRINSQVNNKTSTGGSSTRGSSSKSKTPTAGEIIKSLPTGNRSIEDIRKATYAALGWGQKEIDADNAKYEKIVSNAKMTVV